MNKNRDRDESILMRWLKGDKQKSIASDYSLSRERVNQIIHKMARIELHRFYHEFPQLFRYVFMDYCARNFRSTVGREDCLEILNLWFERKIPVVKWPVIYKEIWKTLFDDSRCLLNELLEYIGGYQAVGTYY